MNIEDLGNIGEFIGSLGVIFSLIYLGKQIKQQNEVTRGEALICRCVRGHGI